MLRPYNGTGNGNDSVQVIGHDHPRVQFEMGKMLWNCLPAIPRYLLPFIQPHLPIHDLAHQALPTLDTDGHEIGPGRPVVATGQAYGTPVVLGRIVFHIIPDHVFVRARHPRHRCL